MGNGMNKGWCAHDPMTEERESGRCGLEKGYFPELRSRCHPLLFVASHGLCRPGLVRASYCTAIVLGAQLRLDSDYTPPISSTVLGIWQVNEH